jgi:hypothetical protein
MPYEAWVKSVEILYKETIYMTEFYDVPADDGERHDTAGRIIADGKEWVIRDGWAYPVDGSPVRRPVLRNDGMRAEAGADATGALETADTWQADETLEGLAGHALPRDERSRWPRRAAKIVAGTVALLLLVDAGDNVARMAQSVPGIAVNPLKWSHPGALLDRVDLNPLVGAEDIARLPGEASALNGK